MRKGVFCREENEVVSSGLWPISSKRGLLLPGLLRLSAGDFDEIKLELRLNGGKTVRPKTITLAIVCAIAIAVLFGPGRQPSSGQTTGREGPCGCYTCYWELVPTLYVNFPDPPKNCYGIVSSSQCVVEMAKMPDKGKAFCQKIKKELRITSFKDCPQYAAACEPEERKPEEKQPPDTKCAPPTPWFDTSLDCKELKSTQIVISGGAAIIYMCGYAVFHYTVGTDDLFNEAYRSAMSDFLQNRGLDKVCCDKFEDAVRTGKPCNPRLDVDCDGQPNKSDLTPHGNFPVIDGSFTEPSGANPDAFPPGMTVNAIMPDEPCKGCRWELIKGVLKCNPDPTKRHTYESTWRCPSTGKVVQVDKLSQPGAPCPD